MSTPRWIDLPTASTRSGRSVGHLARQCRDRWQAAGAAEQRRPPDGKTKAEWFLREDADPAFAAVKFPEQLSTAAALKHVPGDKRNEALQRNQIVTEWLKRRQAGLVLNLNEAKVTAQFLDHLLIDRNLSITRATLFNWYKRQRAGGAAALVDQRGGRGGKGEPRPADPFLDDVKHLYLSLSQPRLTRCYEMALGRAAEKGWKTCSYRSVARFIEAIPTPVKVRYRFGQDAYQNECEPYIERDYSSLAVNEVWCSDHHQFDVICRDGDAFCRPWLTAWQDVRSRKIVGYCIFNHAPNTDTILQALFNATHPERNNNGVPLLTYTDNGKDYDSYVFQGVTKQERRQLRGKRDEHVFYGRTTFLRRRLKVDLDVERIDGIYPHLGIETMHAWPFHGQSKPIERFFGTIATGDVRFFSTYCGNSPANRREDLQLQLERGKAPTLAEFQDWFAAWLEEAYHGQVHTGDGLDGLTPARAFDAHLALGRKRVPDVPTLEVLLLRKTRPVKVGQNGVLYQGIRYGAYCPALIELFGKEVCLRVDDNDLSQVQIWTAADRFVCLAPANQRLPFLANSQDLRKAIAEKQVHRKLLRNYIEQRPRMQEDLPDRVIRAAAQRRKAAQADASPPPPPGAIVPVRSPLEEAMPALQRAMQNHQARRAVGAESMSFGQLGDALAANQSNSVEPNASAEAEDAFFMRFGQADEETRS